MKNKTICIIFLNLKLIVKFINHVLILQFIDYTNLSTRQKSLADCIYAKDLAELGAFRSQSDSSVISCYKCGHNFDIQEILSKKRACNLDFLEAGRLIHATHRPWCELLEQIQPSARDAILGNKRNLLFWIFIHKIFSDYIQCAFRV